MNRRDVLKLGAVAGTASGCATVLSAEAPVVPDSLGALFAKLDGQLRRLEGEPLLPSLLGDAPNKDAADRAPWFQEGDRLARQTLKAFLVAGTFQSLTAEQWQQPLAVERLQAAMADLDEGMLGVTAMLEGMTDRDKRALGEQLRKNPDLGMRIMGAIDERAGEYGVSAEGRLKLRSASATTMSRLRQSPDLHITDTTTKLRKLEVRHGVAEEARRRLGVSMLSMALFDQQSPEQPASGGAAPLSPPPPPPSVEALPEVEAVDAGVQPVGETLEQRQARSRRTTGIISMTVGGVALGLTALAIFSGFTSNVFGATIGVLLGVTGLVALIVGLVMFLSSL
jgi:hypothetical protein